ncbi:MAG: BtrH N-terminal domain-containing protein [Clostridia bacterium]|nr:BtrH N-terminal domain-containing protein [Clostridia bacterium]
MKSIIQRIDMIEGKICILSCMRTILNYWRISIPEELLLGLGAGLQFRFAQAKEDINAVDVNCLDIILDKKHLFNFCSSYLGINIYENTYLSKSKITDSIKNELSSNRPVLLVVNSNYLNYWPDTIKMSIGHFIICYGWNEDEGYAMVMDTAIPSPSNPNFKGKISLDSLEKALDCSDLFLGKGYTMWSFIPTNKPTVALNSLITQGLNYSYESMTYKNTHSLDWNNLKINYNCGLDGIQELHDFLCSISDSGLTEDNIAILGELFSLLSSYGGPYPSRLLYSLFLDWATKEVCLPSSLSKKYDDIANQWKILSNLLLSVAQSKNISRLIRAIERLKNIYELEKSALTTLKETIVNEEN